MPSIRKKKKKRTYVRTFRDCKYYDTTERDHGSIGTNLPREEAPLRVRHDSEVAAVLGAQAGDAVGRAIGVERVRLGRAVGVVHEPAVSYASCRTTAAVSCHTAISCGDICSPKGKFMAHVYACAREYSNGS